MSSAGLALQGLPCRPWTCGCVPAASLGKALILLNPPWMISGEHKAVEALRSSLCLAARAMTIPGAVPQAGGLLGDLLYLFSPKKKVFCSTLHVERRLEVPLCQASNSAGGWLIQHFNSSTARACEGDMGGLAAGAEHGRARSGLAPSLGLPDQPCLCQLGQPAAATGGIGRQLSCFACGFKMKHWKRPLYICQ